MLTTTEVEDAIEEAIEEKDLNYAVALLRDNEAMFTPQELDRQMNKIKEACLTLR